MVARDRLEKIVSIVAFPILAGGAVLSLAAALAFTGRLTTGWVLLTSSVAIAVAYALEWLIPYRREWSSWSDKSIPSDIGHLILSMMTSENVAPLVTAWLLVKGAALAGGPLVDLFDDKLPLSVNILLSLGASQLLDYWRHRMLHELPFVWPIHSIHHAIPRFNSTKTSRNHFLDILSRQLLIYVPLLALGAPPVAMLLDAALITLIGIPAHSNIAFRIPTFVHRLIATPHVHRIHHNRDVSLANGNYGTVVPWFDMMFGTYRAPEGVDVAREVVGVVDHPVPRNFIAEVAAPLLWPWFVNRARQAPEHM